jgi:hypothetical protein
VGREAEFPTSRDGFAILIGLETIVSSADMLASSSASQSEMTGESWGEVSGLKIHGFAVDETKCTFRVIIALLFVKTKPLFLIFCHFESEAQLTGVS